MHPQFDQASNLTEEVIASAIAVYSARATYQFPQIPTYGRAWRLFLTGANAPQQFNL